MKDELHQFITQQAQQFCISRGVEIPEDLIHEIESPRSRDHGDLATNICLKLARPLKQNPLLIATDLGEQLSQAIAKDPAWSSRLAKVEVDGPGFINFFLTQMHSVDILKKVRQEGAEFGKTNYGKGSRVILEYVSANPTGPLTIAHGRQACVGDTLARILQSSGHQVHREYYLNDTGNQMNILGRSVFCRYLECLGKEVSFPEEGYQGDYIRDIGKELAERDGEKWVEAKPEEVMEFMAAFAADGILNTIRDDLEQISVAFDEFYSEKELRSKGLIEKTLAEFKNQDEIYEADGALWFRSTAYKDDKDRVLKKSDGSYTYLAPDIAYHHTKYQRGFERLINLWGPDHHGYIPRMQSAMAALGHDAENLKVLIVQLTTLFRNGAPVRMSTRKGEFVTLKELMNEVGTDAARLFFLIRKVESPLDFDLDLAKSKSQENPVYYLQYAHARIASLIQYSGRAVLETADVSLLKEEAEQDLAKMLALFPEAIVEASRLLEPFRIVDYLRDLATTFHKFYTLHQVVSEDAPLSDARLFLADCTKTVLGNGLSLLGVSKPDKM